MPLFTDFYLIYGWAKTLIMDNVYTGYYPYPFYVLFSPLTLIPKEIAGAIWLIVCLAVLVAIMKRKAVMWIFYYPLLFHLYYNQTSLVFWGLFTIGSPLSLAFMTLKPQLFLLAIPKLIEWYKTDITKLYKTAIYIVCLQLPFLLMRPTWPIEFIKNQFTGMRTREVSPSLWTVPILLIIWVIILFLIRKWVSRNNLWTAAIMPLNPFIKFYDFIFLLNSKSKIGLFIASFGMVAVALNTENDSFMWVASFLAIYVLAERYISNLFVKENTNAAVPVQV